MEDLSLHILDIAENGIHAGAKSIRITVEEDTLRDWMRITIEDDGEGMERNLLEKAFDPFVTTRTTRRVGLGLPLFYEAARMAGGDAFVESAPGRGTRVVGTFQYRHIDRKPLGDMSQTLLTLIAGYPDLEFHYDHRRNHHRYVLDTACVKDGLEGLRINHPEVLQFLRENLAEGFRGLGDPSQ